jgi:uncharacterized protein YjiS (DUF1127 family)
MADALPSVQTVANRSDRIHAVPAPFGARRLRAASIAAGIIAVVHTWQRRRRDRRSLAHLDPHMLRDIGLDAQVAALEAEKPFWRA